MARGARLLASGSNGAGQLGIGHAEDVSTWTSCSFADTLAGSPDDRLRNVLPGRVLAIASGAGHAVLLLEENGRQGPSTASQPENTSIWVTGSNDFGQLGPNHLVCATEPADFSWKRLNIDEYLKLASLELSRRHRYRPKHVACSWTTTFICFERAEQLEKGGWHRQSDVIISFGTNDFGELGAGIMQGDGYSSKKPKDPVQLVHFRKQAGEKGIISIRKIKASHRNVACIVDLLPEEGSSGLSESRVHGWGAGRHGQLDPKTGVAARGPYSPSRASKEALEPSGIGSSGAAVSSSKAGSPRAVGGIKFRKSEFPSIYPAPVSLDATSVLKLEPGVKIHYDDLAIGAGHIVLRIVTEGDPSKNEIAGFGNNAKAQLGFVSLRSTKWGSIGCTWNGTFVTALDSPRQIFSTGTNTHGQLGYSDISPGARLGPQASPMHRVALAVEMDWGSEDLEIICGSEHVIILAAAPAAHIRAWVWGWNEHGNLGLGDVCDRWTPTEVSLDRNLKIMGAWAGCGTSWMAVEEEVDAMH